MIGLELRIARKGYPAVGGAPPLLIYDDFELSVAPGSFLCLLGPSGLGKTTLLNLVAGLDHDWQGSLAFTDGRRPRIAYAFQTPRLLPWRTLLDNLLLVLPPTAAARCTALGLLEELGLAEAAQVYPERLSLGMQRRAALARAFAVEPDLLLMDEPFVSLDEPTADRLRDLLRRLLANRPATVLFVTHDSREAVRLADRIVVLEGPPPARVLRDLAVGLSPDQRRDEASVQAFRAEVLARRGGDDPQTGHPRTARDDLRDLRGV